MGSPPTSASELVAEPTVATLADSPAEPPAEIQPPHPPEKKPSKRPLYWLIGGVAVAVTAIVGVILFSQPAIPVVEGISQITDDGYPKVPSAVVSDGARVYFNEIRNGTQVLAQVAATGGESGLIAQSVPGSYLAAYASDPPRVLLIANEFRNHPLWLLPLPAGEPRKLGELTGFDATLSPNGTIAFVQPGELYLAHGDGSDPRKLFSLPVLIEGPVISPDGTKIALVLTFATTESPSGDQFAPNRAFGTIFLEAPPSMEMR